MARRGWLSKEFYQRYTIKELHEYLKQYTTLSDIFIEEYGVYSRLDDETKKRVNDMHPLMLSYYDEDWAYVILTERKY